MKEKLEKIYSALFAVFCFTIPFSQFGEAIPNIAMIPLIGLFPFLISKKEWRNFIGNPFYIFAALVLLIFIETLIFMRWDDMKFFTKILIIPIIFFLAIPEKNKQISLLGFLSGAFILMISTYARIIGYTFNNKEFDFSVGKFINDILMGDRPYVGFVYVLSILFCAYFFLQTKKIIYKIFLALSTSLFFLLIFIISARLSLLSLICVAFLSFFYIKNWKIPVILVTGAIVSVFLLIKFNPNFIDRFYSGFKQENYTLKKAIIMEPRYHIWDCATGIIMEENAFLKGVGFKKTTELLTNCFKSHDNFLSNEHRQYFIESNFNTHNQFLGIYLSSGIFALLLLLYFFITSFFQTRKNYFAFASIFALFLFCLVENVLSRQMGCLLFGFIWVFVYSSIQKSKTDSTVKKSN